MQNIESASFKSIRGWFEGLEARRMLAAFELSSLLSESGGDGSAGFAAEAGDIFVLGDINGDGLDDFIAADDTANVIDQPGNWKAEATEGAVYVILGNSNGTPPEFDPGEFARTDGFTIVGNPSDGVEPRDGATQVGAGTFVAAGGDINGDGIDDVVIHNRWATVNGQADVGRVYVVFGRGSDNPFPSQFELSTLLASQNSDGNLGFVISGSVEGESFGATSDLSGDVNGDGVNDLIVTSSAESGQAFVVFGRSEETTFPQEFTPTEVGQGAGQVAGVVVDGPNTAETLFGDFQPSLDADINGDAFDDIVIGAPWATPNEGTSDARVRAGQTYVIYGGANLPGLIDVNDLLTSNGGDGSAGFVINGIDGDPDFSNSLHDASGASVFAGGDFNGDGLDDLAIGAPVSRGPQGQARAGEAYVVFGRQAAFGAPAFSAEFELSALDGINGLVVRGLDEEGLFARHVALADFNGDALVDLIVTQGQGDPGGRTDAGQVFVIYGTSETTILKSIDTNRIATDSQIGILINGISAGDKVGGWDNSASASLLRVGDFNGDDYGDVAVTSYSSDVPVYLVYGGEDVIPAPLITIDDVSVSEGDSESVTATFTVTRSGDASSPVSVDYSTADGTALAGSDYQSAAGTLNFAAGETTKLINVDVLGDVIEEFDESFYVDLANAVGATITDAQAVATIVDDDSTAEFGSLYIHDIRFDSKRGGKDFRAVVEVRDEDGTPVAEIALKVDFNGVTYMLTTDNLGLARTSWTRNLATGDYYADAYDLALEGFEWTPFDLDLEDDSDGDGNADDLLQV